MPATLSRSFSRKMLSSAFTSWYVVVIVIALEDTYVLFKARFRSVFNSSRYFKTKHFFSRHELRRHVNSSYKCTACGTASEPKPCYRFEKFSMTISRITENAGGPAKQEVVPVVKAYGKQLSSQNKKVNAHLGTQYVCDVKVQCWIVPLTRRITVSVCI